MTEPMSSPKSPARDGAPSGTPSDERGDSPAELQDLSAATVELRDRAQFETDKKAVYE